MYFSKNYKKKKKKNKNFIFMSTKNKKRAMSTRFAPVIIIVVCFSSKQTIVSVISFLCVKYRGKGFTDGYIEERREREKKKKKSR